MNIRRNDIILAAVLLLAGGALTLWLFATRQTGGHVTVTVDGEDDMIVMDLGERVTVTVDGDLLMELPLNEDTQVVIGGEEHSNTLVIQNGTAQVIAADCPDQICVRQGAIQYDGETIVCLPHKLVVAVESGAGNGIDAAVK